MTFHDPFMTFDQVAPTLVSLATFACLTLGGAPLHASTVFASLALFNLLRSVISHDLP